MKQFKTFYYFELTSVQQKEKRKKVLPLLYFPKMFSRAIKHDIFLKIYSVQGFLNYIIQLSGLFFFRQYRG